MAFLGLGDVEGRAGMSQSPSDPKVLNVTQALAQALALHGQGRLADAERLYAAILAVRPGHAEALQMTGLIKLATGKPAEALPLVSAAIRQALKGKIKDNLHKIYRDHACISALEDFLDRAARR